MSRERLVGGAAMVVYLTFFFLYIFWSGSPFSGRIFGYVALHLKS